MEKETIQASISDSKETPSSVENKEVTQIPAQNTKDVEFWIFNRKVLTLNLLECESLWELKSGIVLHPLISLFPNFEFVFEENEIGKVLSLTQYLQDKPLKKGENYRIEMVPKDPTIQESRGAVLSLVQLIQNPSTFLSNQMMKFFEIIGKQDFISQMLEDLTFECGEVSIEEALEPNLSSAEQFVRLEEFGKSKVLRLDSEKESVVQELQFLRQLVLPVNAQVNLQGFEEYFEVLVETMERKFLGFVFCKRGVYLSRRLEPKTQGEEVSLQLLSLPRENRKRLSGFFPSMIPLLSQESEAFAQRFQEFLDRDLAKVENSGVALMMNVVVDDARFENKHWLKSNVAQQHKLYGEGEWTCLTGRTATANVDVVCFGKAAFGANGRSEDSHAKVA